MATDRRQNKERVMETEVAHDETAFYASVSVKLLKLWNLYFPQCNWISSVDPLCLIYADFSLKYNPDDVITLIFPGRPLSRKSRRRNQAKKENRRMERHHFSIIMCNLRLLDNEMDEAAAWVRRQRDLRETWLQATITCLQTDKMGRLCSSDMNLIGWAASVTHYTVYTDLR